MDRAVRGLNGIGLAGVLARLAAGRSGARQIARRSGISARTVARAIAALRREGYRIVSLRERGRWGYELRTKPDRGGGDPALKLVGLGESRRGDLSREHDEYLYGGRP